MADWRDAPIVEMIARQLISEHHGHLAEAKIKYIFRDGKWSSQDKTTWAKAYKVSERDNFLTGYDFYIVVNYGVWNELDPKTREALVDHELSHCGQKEDGSWCIWGHDVEDFAAIVRRHGLWNESVKMYLAAAEKRENEEQLELFGDSEAEAGEDDYSDLLQQVEEGLERQNARRRVDWILSNSVGDPNYESNIPQLTDDELIHCLRHEKRSTGLRKLMAEAKRRGISSAIVFLEEEEEDTDPDGHGTCRVCGCTDDMACEGGCYWVEPDLCSRCAGENTQDPEPAALASRNYLDENGRELFVSAGIGQREYGTFRRSGTGGLHRVKSPAMPMVATREEAQKNLDAWAQKKGLKQTGEEAKSA